MTDEECATCKGAGCEIEEWIDGMSTPSFHHLCRHIQRYGLKRGIITEEQIESVGSQFGEKVALQLEAADNTKQ